jgi:hypothetical protein
MRPLAVAVASILALLAALHIYWAVGGRWSRAVAVPELDGRSVISPGPVACAAVAALLGAAALLLLGRGGVVPLPLPRWIVAAGSWMVGLVFLLRAIGDFRYFGIFRRVSGTAFARNDALLYTPLCLLLAAAALVLAWRGPLHGHLGSVTTSVVPRA